MPGYPMRNINSVPPSSTVTLLPEGPARNFWEEISDIRDSLIPRLNESVRGVEELQSKELNNVDADDITTKKLHQRNENTNDLIAELRSRIKNLEGATTPTNKDHVEGVKTLFRDAIRKYQVVQQKYRDAIKERLGQRYRLANPEATPEEVRKFVDGGGQVLTQFLPDREVRREVRGRHNDIKRIECSLVELARLFENVTEEVNQQDKHIDDVTHQATEIEKDVENGVSNVHKAVDSARSARKKRWICFIITLVILLIVGIVVGITVQRSLVNNNASKTH